MTVRIIRASTVIQEISCDYVDTQANGIEGTCIISDDRGWMTLCTCKLALLTTKTLAVASKIGYSDFVHVVNTLDDGAKRTAR